jgi:Mg-chelatase subunit ChlD
MDSTRRQGRWSIMSESESATTQITFVLDASGSMARIKADTIGGFNGFLRDQREEPGTARVSLYEFASDVEQVYHGKAIETADELDAETYTPGGGTALYDAIVRAIRDTAGFIAHADGTIENVVIVVLTDGRENASETPQEVVRERVEECRAEAGWEFLFIGANQDAALTAERMGMDADNSLDMAHTGEGTRAAYTSTSEQVSQVRRTGSTSGYAEHDRDRQRGEALDDGTNEVN